MNVGPELAEKIISPEIENECDYLSQRHFGSMFLRPIEQGEIREIVHKWKN